MDKVKGGQDKPNNSPGLIILQWLTYVFWVWTTIAIFATSLMTTIYYISGSGAGEQIAYGIAAILVLLPISMACDLFYIKKEPIKKTGAASIIMIVHTVIFALCGVGALVTIVICLVNLLINGASNIIKTFIICAVIMLVIYSILFLRTIAFDKLFTKRHLAIILLAIISIVIVIISIIGPASNAALTKNDRLIEERLQYVTMGIDSYIASNKQLPNNLEQLNLDSESKKLVSENLITYKKVDSSTASDENTYKYQLCVTYKKADSRTDEPDPSTYDNYDYSSSLNTYGHQAGEVCYRLTASTTQRYKANNLK